MRVSPSHVDATQLSHAPSRFRGTRRGVTNVGAESPHAGWPCVHRPCLLAAGRGRRGRKRSRRANWAECKAHTHGLPGCSAVQVSCLSSGYFRKGQIPHAVGRLGRIFVSWLGRIGGYIGEGSRSTQYTRCLPTHTQTGCTSRALVWMKGEGVHVHAHLIARE